MAITFRVDDVTATADPIATCSLAERFGDALSFGGDGAMRVVADESAKIHPLLGAVHAAFSQHRPLALSPDAVWLTIAQGVAQHVRLNAEALRSRLVRHAGKRRLEVTIPHAFSAEPVAVGSFIGAFRATIAAAIGDGRARLLTCDFSTSTDVERVASEVVLMDVFSPYFDYVLFGVCGIPEITLLGEPRDWRTIRERVDVLAELDLGWWASSLAPICDKLVTASEGRPDIDFFRAIYKPQKAYGWDRIVGWIARLFPYIGQAGRFTERNPLLERSLDWKPPEAKHGSYAGPGITTEDVSPRPGSCLIRYQDLTTKERFDISMEGGLMAVELDAQGRLIPRAAWTLRRSSGSIDAVIEGLRERSDVVLTAPEASANSDDRMIDGLLAEQLALFDAFSEARLFVGAGEWRVRSRRDFERIILGKSKGNPGIGLTRMIDLPDGTFIAHCYTGSVYLVRLRDSELDAPRPPRQGKINDPAEIEVDPTPTIPGLPRRTSRERAEDVPTVARSLAELLERALRTNGSLDLPSLGSLRDAVPPWMLG